jgi:hypothetical protein
MMFKAQQRRAGLGPIGGWGVGAALAVAVLGAMVVGVPGVAGAQSATTGISSSSPTLDPGQTLTGGHFLTSGSYRLVVQATDGNVVLYHGSQALWGTSTGGYPGDRLVMQRDGNLVLYSTANKAIWNTDTATGDRYTLVLTNNGSEGGLEVTRADGNPVWTDMSLFGGQSLTARQLLYFAGFRFVVQGSDGNVVLYQGNNALWATGIVGHPGDRLVMQRDGNLVVYSGSRAIWSSGTAENPGDFMFLNGGNVEIRARSGATLWSR